MLSSKLVSWQLFLVLLVWTCAVLVKPWAVDGSLFGSKSLSSIDGAREYNSFFFGVSPSSTYPPPSDLEEEQDIVESAQKGSEPGAQTDRKATGSPAALFPSISQTHTSILQNAPTLLRSPRNILDRLTSRRRAQHDSRPTRETSHPPHPHIYSSQPAPVANQRRAQEQQHIREQDENAPPELKVELDSSAFECTGKDISISDPDTTISTLVAGNGSSTANTATDPSPRRSQNPLSMYDLSSGRSKAQGSCFGLVVGMIVAIVWL